jgi:hypothetical protein
MEIARNVLGKLAADILATAPLEERMTLAWPLACGARVAAKSKAMQFVEGILQVEVPDADWRRQLAQLSWQYMQSLRALSGQELREIKFVIRRGSIV